VSNNRNHTELIALSDDLLAGGRRALARAITLIESTRKEHQQQATILLSNILPKTGSSIRVGISGTPGVGKSTFIESLGLHLITLGHHVAVLAVDPSSPRTGGSILGDKTRMEVLSRHQNAFVRPSPSGGTLGGVARRTREAILCAEAAGFDIVLVETVGVGQSETAVANLTDIFLLLLNPGGGDDVQGMKKGIMELADIIAVNKADGEFIHVAEKTQRDYAAALDLIRPRDADGVPKVYTCSALSGKGVPKVWSAISKFKKTALKTGILSKRRTERAIHWMWDEVNANLLDELKTNIKIVRGIETAEHQVRKGMKTPSAAAEDILKLFAEVYVNARKYE